MRCTANRAKFPFLGLAVLAGLLGAEPVLLSTRFFAGHDHVPCAPAAPLASLFGLRPEGRAVHSQSVLDQGILIVRDTSGIIGREEFTITTTGQGISIATMTLYPPRRTRVTLRSTISLSADSTPTTATFTASNGRDRSVLAQFTRRRLTIRVNAPQGESVAEYPRPPRALVVDDSIFALYAVPPGMAAGSLQLVAPRTGRRTEAEFENLGVSMTTVAGERRQLSHVLLRTGTGTRHVWYDDAGRLVKVELETGLVAERTPAGSTGW